MDMRVKERYQQWVSEECFDQSTKDELLAITDENEIEDRFICDIKFGTGGMRGLMGAGPNRMNIYTVGRVTKGFVKYLSNNFSKAMCKDKGVVIAYDSRNNSVEFAKVTANILTSNGIRVYFFKEPVPTPELSFAIRYFGCIAGVVITASHNSKEYNGYKIYDESGSQLVPYQVKAITDYVEKIQDYTIGWLSQNDELLQYIDITNEFTDVILKESITSEGKNNLKIVYTPLHGTAIIPVCELLTKAGFDDVIVVPEQATLDGEFPTVKVPNPEDLSALELSIKLSKENGADIIIATDPDGDRLGVGVKTGEDYKLLTGNQVGALIVDFVMSFKNISKYKKPAIVKTVVTSELGADIARKYGVSVFSTLTGFKYIGEKMNQFEYAKVSGNIQCDYDFILGYEESCGYLVGTYARDKDASVASLLICEMAAEYKSKGMTLLDRLEQLYRLFGYYYDAQDSFKFPGEAGKKIMNVIMAQFRGGTPLFETAEKVVDYSVIQPAERGFGTLPTSNVLKYFLSDGSWIAIRPSGTEPKLKVYYSVKGTTKEEALDKFDKYRKTIKKHIEDIKEV